MSEIWKDAVGYEGVYLVSSEGRIKSVPRTASNNFYPEKMKVFREKRGYLDVRLLRKTMLVHRVVALTFLPNPNNYPCVLHKNNIRNDNRVSNLKWGTYLENNQQCIVEGRYTPRGIKVIDTSTGIIYDNMLSCWSLSNSKSYSAFRSSLLGVTKKKTNFKII